MTSTAVEHLPSVGVTSLTFPLTAAAGVDATARDVLDGLDLSGRLAVVTGGYSGIGLETTRALAAAGATVVGYLLADRVFNIPFEFNGALWLVAIAGGAAAVAAAGWLGTRGTLSRPPVEVLRQAG